MDVKEKIMKRNIPTALALILFICAFITIGSAALANTQESEIEVNPSLISTNQNVSYKDSVYILYAVDTAGYEPKELEMLFWKEKPSSLTDTPFYTDSTSAEYAPENSTVYFASTFTSFGIAAKDAPDYVYSALHVKGTNIYGSLTRYSVLQYIYERQINPKSTEKQHRVYDAVLEYTESTQELFSHDTENTPSSLYYVSVNGGLISDGFDSGTYKAGTKLTITASDTEGFSMWVDENGITVSSEPSFSLSVESAHKQYTAVSAYTVSAVGGSVDRESGLYTYGESVTVTAAPTKTIDGSTLYFESWINSAGETVSRLATQSFTVTKDETYTASYITDNDSLTAFKYENKESAPKLSSSPSSAISASSYTDYAQRSNECQAIDGYSIKYYSEKQDTSDAATYLNHIFTSIENADAVRLSLDICIDGRDINFDGQSFGDGNLNQTEDFFTVTGITKLYEIIVSADGTSVFSVTVDAVIESGTVIGYKIMNSDTVLYLDSLYTLTFEMGTDVCNLYIGDSYIASIAETNTEIGLKSSELYLSVKLCESTKGNIFLDNITYIGYKTE